MIDYEIYVISLRDQQSRRKNIEDQLLSLGLNKFEFIDAIDYRNNEIHDLKSIFDIEKFSSKYGREPTAGEIGCLYSHIKALKKASMLPSDFRILILEDDALLMPRIVDFINCEDELDGIHILGYVKTTLRMARYLCFKKPLRDRVSYSNFYTGSLSSEWSCGAVAYHLTPAAALKILNFIPVRPSHVADDWRFYKQIVTVRHVRPLMAFEDYKNQPSSLEGRRRQTSQKKSIFVANISRVSSLCKAIITNIFIYIRVIR